MGIAKRFISAWSHAHCDIERPYKRTDLFEMALAADHLAALEIFNMEKTDPKLMSALKKEFFSSIRTSIPKQRNLNRDYETVIYVSELTESPENVSYRFYGEHNRPEKSVRKRIARKKRPVSSPNSPIDPFDACDLYLVPPTPHAQYLTQDLDGVFKIPEHERHVFLTEHDIEVKLDRLRDDANPKILIMFAEQTLIERNGADHIKLMEQILYNPGSLLC